MCGVVVVVEMKDSSDKSPLNRQAGAGIRFPRPGQRDSRLRFSRRVTVTTMAAPQIDPNSAVYTTDEVRFLLIAVGDADIHF